MLRAKVDSVVSDLPVLNILLIDIRVGCDVQVLGVIGIRRVCEVLIGGDQSRSFVGLSVSSRRSSGECSN